MSSPGEDFQRMALEGPVAYRAKLAYEQKQREGEIKRNEEREERVAKVVRRWEEKFEAEVHEVYLLDGDGTELEFCIEGHGANPKVVGRVTKDYSGGGPAKEVVSFHLRVKHTPFDRLVRHPIEDFWKSEKSPPTYEVNFFASDVGLGQALDRDWRRLSIAGWRGKRLVLR